ncbi:hypothetical protein QIS99_20715 [Streptomyces sp. B-S-A8]|uniref:Cytochrome b/b6 domain-containing protein n=1 Tax=Streptomyces solicavernae TaxID=3043614 RepID=A0ABT6RVY5_9ACTN|nr:hypothetical protein [Streptomyces sp. B-S-A8]MDI3388608.1 hypothetical protein [Streptomyces sp. B-S-A8]
MSRTVRGGLVAALLLLIPLTVVTGGDGLREALDFTTGVLALVALTCSVVWGLVASDRIFLTTRHRLLAQAVHRGTAVASTGFLLLHGTVKLVLDHVSLLGALVPFSLGLSGTGVLIGLGALAGLLMAVTGVTGALRSAFASPAHAAGRWRALHTLAYPAWCAALVHGLYAGREPSGFVIALYCLCLVAVAGALALRSAPPPVKRQVARRLLALLDPAPRGRRSAHREPPRRQAPLPGMEPPSAAPPPPPGDIPVRPRWTPHPPPRGRENPYGNEYGSGPHASGLRHAPPASPLGETMHRPPVAPAPGSDMTAAYRALSAPPTPCPSPPPPPARAPHPGQEPPTYTPRAYDPDDSGETPTVTAHQAARKATPHRPSQKDMPPYGPPTSGEPWSASGSTGGRP